MTNEINQDELLPIGSVIKLRNVKKEVMIYGRHQLQTKTNKIFDYLAVPYPEGNLTTDFNVFFNRGQIEIVVHKGYESSSEKILREHIEEDLVVSRKNGLKYEG